MADLREQDVSMKFCFKMGKNGMEDFEMLKVAFGEQTVVKAPAFEWFMQLLLKMVLFVGSITLFLSHMR
jgi:hypothetical protein